MRLRQRIAAPVVAEAEHVSAAQGVGGDGRRGFLSRYGCHFSLSKTSVFIRDLSAVSPSMNCVHGVLHFQLTALPSINCRFGITKPRMSRIPVSSKYFTVRFSPLLACGFDVELRELVGFANSVRAFEQPLIPVYDLRRFGAGSVHRANRPLPHRLL